MCDEHLAGQISFKSGKYIIPIIFIRMEGILVEISPEFSASRDLHSFRTPLQQMSRRSCRRPMENNTGNPYRDSSSICEVEGCSNQKPCLLSARVFFFSSLYLSSYLLMRSRLCPSFSFIERFMEKSGLLLSSRDFFTSM